MLAHAADRRSADRQSPLARASRAVMARVPDAAVAAPMRRDADRDDGLAGRLARSVRARGSAPVLQRAIIAIDGPNDSGVAKQATRNCLENLKKKDRGAPFGPTLVTAKGKRPKLGQNETLFILGHGAGDQRADDVAGLDPEDMGTAINTWYGKAKFTGKIKFVACKSARSDPKEHGGKTFAEEVRDWFNDHATTSFRPTSIDGIIGIGWASEDTGKLESIDLPAYRGLQESEKADFALTDVGLRKAAIEQHLGPVGAPGSGDRRVTGKNTKGGGTVRYDTAYPVVHTPEHPVVRFFQGIGSFVTSIFD